MTKSQTVLLALFSAVVAGVIYKFVPDLKDVSLGLAGLTLALLGWAKQHPADAAELAAASVTTTATETVTRPVVGAVPQRKDGGFVRVGGLFAALALALSVSGCTGTTPTPAQVVNAIVTCTTTTCTAAPSSDACAQLSGDVMTCLSGGTVAACLAGIPDLVAVGYADIVCVVAALAETPAAGKVGASTRVQHAAADWLNRQRVTVRQ